MTSCISFSVTTIASPLARNNMAHSCLLQNVCEEILGGFSMEGWKEVYPSIGSLGSRHLLNFGEGSGHQNL